MPSIQAQNGQKVCYGKNVISGDKLYIFCCCAMFFPPYPQLTNENKIREIYIYTHISQNTKAFSILLCYLGKYYKIDPVMRQPDKYIFLFITRVVVTRSFYNLNSWIASERSQPWSQHCHCSIYNETMTCLMCGDRVRGP